MRKLAYVLLLLIPALSAYAGESVLALMGKTTHLNPKVVKLAFQAYHCALKKEKITHPIITIIDYSLPSTMKRLWVLDAAHKKILFNTLVAHGQGSGLTYSHYFSDIPDSHTSSLGTFLTGSPYTGRYGFSLRLYGLEPGFNQHAFTRDIVIHSAWYVNEDFGKSHGYIGRSWGCLALNTKVIAPVINTIKKGTLLFAYYPDDNWLSHSHYLHCDS